MSTPRSPAPPGLIRNLYFRWKALRLPWRRQFLAGSDLAGNTFWEFKDALNSNRFRRIVKYSRKGHYSDVVISPQWHQWLRHTRFDAPSVQEQQYDVARRAQMKQLAAQADERWRAKESFLDAPARQQTEPAIGVRDPGGYVQQTEPEGQQGVKSGVEEAEKIPRVVEGEEVDEGRFKGGARERAKPRRVREEAPWEKQQRRGAPDEQFAPQAWTPGGVGRR